MNFNTAFWKWFGKSVVCSADGSPKLVYHGAPSKSVWDSERHVFRQTNIIDEFKVTPSARAGFLGSERRVIAPSFFFSESPYLARAFGSNRSDSPNDVTLYKLYLSVQNPLDLRGTKRESSAILKRIGVKVPADKRHMWDVLDDSVAVDAIKAAGYDGAVISEMDAAKEFGLAKSPHYGDTWAVFSPTQIKSVDNDGTWDADDPKIASNPPSRLVREAERIIRRLEGNPGPNRAEASKMVSIKHVSQDPHRYLAINKRTGDPIGEIEEDRTEAREKAIAILERILDQEQRRAGY